MVSTPQRQDEQPLLLKLQPLNEISADVETVNSPEKLKQWENMMAEKLGLNTAERVGELGATKTIQWSHGEADYTDVDFA